MKSYVENTMKDNRLFDSKGLVESKASHDDLLKYWTNELCAQQPQLFDIVLCVSQHVARHCARPL